MLFKNGLVLFISLVLILGFSGCGKKEAGQEGESAEQPVKESVVPGEMVLIPAGEYSIGTNTPKDSDAYPEHKVKLPAFWIDKYEVTNFEFQGFSIDARYAGEGVKEGKDWRIFVTQDKALFPIQYITWKDAEEYCRHKGKRLPTEEEWEAAARGPKGLPYPWGNEWVDRKSNTAESGTLKPVAIGEYDDVSEFGVHDMLGNVREWTSSWWAMYPGNPKKDPQSGKKSHIVLRGLSPNHRGKMAKLWDRSGIIPAFVGDVGCRCAKDASPEDVAKAQGK